MDELRLSIIAGVIAGMEYIDVSTSSKGVVALFCVACVAAEMQLANEPWRASRVAHAYGEFCGKTQTTVWQNMWRALKASAWNGNVSGAIKYLVSKGVEYENRISVRKRG